MSWKPSDSGLEYLSHVGLSTDERISYEWDESVKRYPEAFPGELGVARDWLPTRRDDRPAIWDAPRGID